VASALKKVFRFETHHRILVYTIILIATIVFVRSAVKLYDPNPIFFNLQLHHFDYGLFMLLIIVKLLLFGGRKLDGLYLVLAAVASGLVIDEYVFIRQSIVESANGVKIYDSTLPSVLIAILIGVLVTLFIGSLTKRNKT